MQQGFIHIYTGNGKGKTTAAIGLAIRAVGAEKKVFIGQFVKNMIYSEIKTINSIIPQIQTAQYGNSCFLKRDINEEDKIAAQKGLTDIKEKLTSNLYDVVILDEITIAIYYKLISVKDVLDVIKQKPKSTELIITGRYAPSELIDIADLISDIQEVKHYYQKGVLSRKGIDV